MVTLQVRNKYHLNEWDVIGSRLEEWVQTHPTQCIVNGCVFPNLVCGRHLPESQIGTYAPKKQLLNGASIHSLSALSHASEAGSNYVQYGPVFRTSKPVHPVGVEALQTLCRQARIPVFAVGGIGSVHRVQQCLSAGAYGVSVGSWILQSNDPIKVIEKITEEIALLMSNPQQSC